ncbi:MAG TPA: FKBP-type peptidyl-prolyl cis-trans isomerase [Verrucomicrobiae bacterium]|nr:FKBP-type peptidyl-prolyl cis-trans isomerase [Verrucomicrobiae bacterium]
MKYQILLALSATLLVVGCNKEDNATTAKNDTAPAASTPSAAAATNSDMITTASGLQYQVLKHGAGTVSPKASDTVKVHYHGTLLDGTVFDSSVERGEPISFPLNGVIPGWTEGLQLMKVGDKFKFIIPPNLAYGPNSPSPKIPPNSTLVFEVELLGIQ